MTRAEDDDAGSVGDNGGLTEKQENFAVALARTGNHSSAYRMSYNVHPNTSPNVVSGSASRLAALPLVAKRVRVLQQQAALETIVSIQEALAWQLDIATADPNEISFTVKRSCRHCHGNGHAYQWVDDAEYMQACIEALDDKKLPPSDEGGYGYTRAPLPALDCPHCLGEGFAEVIVNDTRKLQGKALKLYKGMDYKSGEWVVMMHDQQKAWDMIHRMLGGYNDKLNLSGLLGGAAKVEKLPDGALTEQEAARSYLSLLG